MSGAHGEDLQARMAPILEMIDIARELGVRFFACNSTIGVMRIDPDDLIEGVERAGAPAFLDFAADPDAQLFI